MENKILTIAIPTYNRPDAIRTQVRLLLPQLNDMVCLVVYDNCSTQPVKELFTNEELSHFVIHRNAVNVGGDANIVRCLEHSITKWVWTLGDDDPVKPDAVSIVLDIITKHNNLCYINFGNVEHQFVTNQSEFLAYISKPGALGRSFFMSHCVFNMHLVKSHLFYYYKMLTSQIGQIGFIVRYFEDNTGASALFLKNYLVNYNTGELTWNPLNLIVNSSVIIDQTRMYKDMYAPSLYRALGNMYLGYLMYYKMSFSDYVYYYRYIKCKLGLFNLLRYNTIALFAFYIMFLLPQRVFNRLKNLGIRYYKSRKNG